MKVPPFKVASRDFRPRARPSSLRPGEHLHGGEGGQAKPESRRGWLGGGQALPLGGGLGVGSNTEGSPQVSSAHPPWLSGQEGGHLTPQSPFRPPPPLLLLPALLSSSAPFPPLPLKTWDLKRPWLLGLCPHLLLAWGAGGNGPKKTLQ